MTQDRPPQSAQPVTPEAMTRLWMSFLSQAIAFTAVLVVATAYIQFDGFRPEWGNYSFALGVLAILPSIPLLREFRELAQRHGHPVPPDPAQLTRMHRKLVTGLAVADLPALVGAGHLFLTAQVVPTLLLCLATVALVYLYRPPATGRRDAGMAG